MNLQLACASLASCALLACALRAPAEAAGQVFFVAPAAGPGVDFTTVHAAINARSDGDIVLLQAGSYPATGTQLELANKALTLIADNASATITGPLVVRDLAANRQVLLRGIDFDVADQGNAVFLLNNLGSMQIEDASLQTSTSLFPFLPGGHALAVSNSTT